MFREKRGRRRGAASSHYAKKEEGKNEGGLLVDQKRAGGNPREGGDNPGLCGPGKQKEKRGKVATTSYFQGERGNVLASTREGEWGGWPAGFTDSREKKKEKRVAQRSNVEEGKSWPLTKEREGKGEQRGSDTIPIPPRERGREGGKGNPRIPSLREWGKRKGGGSVCH